MSMSLLVILTLGIYQYKPSLLGLGGPDTLQPVSVWDTITFRRETVVDPAELEQLRKSVQEYKAKFRSEKMKAELAYKLSDTLTDKEKLLRDLADSLEAKENIISRLNEKNQDLKDSIMDLADLVEMHKNQSELYSGMVDDKTNQYRSKEDSLYLANFKAFAQLYNNSEPQDVAEILSRIDNNDAARILKFMQKKKAGKVIENLPASKAAAILLLGYE
jgi:flagellar motility protein MotE (MotC chaperone)